MPCDVSDGSNRLCKLNSADAQAAVSCRCLDLRLAMLLRVQLCHDVIFVCVYVSLCVLQDSGKDLKPHVGEMAAVSAVQVYELSCVCWS
jgi:hypothetical protein